MLGPDNFKSTVWKQAVSHEEKVALQGMEARNYKGWPDGIFSHMGECHAGRVESVHVVTVLTR